DDSQRAALRYLAGIAAEALEMRQKGLAVAMRAKNSYEDELFGDNAVMRSMLYALPIGISSWGPDLRNRFSNGLDEYALGLPIGSMQGRTLLEISGPQVWEHSRTYFEAALAGQVEKYDASVTRPDGTVRVINIQLLPTQTADSVPDGFISLSRDITDLRQAQEQAKRLVAIVESSDDAIIGTSMDGIVTHWNAGAEHMFGYGREEMLGRQVSTIFPPQTEVRAEEAELNRRVRAGEIVRHAERMRVRKDGSSLVVAATLSPVRDEKGEVIGVSAISRDVSERKETERALALSEAHYRALSDSSPIGVFHADKAGHNTYLNARLQEMLGRDAQQGLDLGWSHNIHPDDRQATVECWRKMLAEGALYDVEFRVVLPQTGTHHLHVRALPVYDKLGEVNGFVGVVEDHTRFRRIEQQLRASEQLLDRAGQLAGVGAWQLDLLTQTLTWSSQTRRMHGLSADCQPTLEEAKQFYAPPARAALARALQEGIEHGWPWDLELPLVTAKGRQAWVRTAGEIEYEDGKAVRTFGAFQDITERKLAERLLTESHELMRVTLKSIGDAVITTDAAGGVRWLNQAAERMTGWSSEAAYGRPLSEVFQVINEDTRQPEENRVTLCLKGIETTVPSSRSLLVSRDGAEYGIEDTAAPIRDTHNNILGVVLVFHDVSQQRRLNDEITRRARYDALTNLVNRTEFEARLERVLASSRDDGATHSLMYIDLDEFKLINDTCGHAMGDRLLCQVSRLMESCMRSHDTLARLGGDEFGILLENCKVEQAQRVAQSICDKMEEYRFIHESQRFRIGASIGLVPLDARWTQLGAALQAADSACYAAKEAGRNRVHVWLDNDILVRARENQNAWASRLEQALDEDRFMLWGQRIAPIGRAGDGRLHCEVLLRLREEGSGPPILPGAFLPAAERFHMMPRIDRWVVRHVFEWLACDAVNLEGLGTLFVNLSGQSIGDRAFHRFVADLASSLAIDTRKLCFEITETAAITHLADANAFIADMRSLGVRIALDDFGAGASSFGYLKALPVDYLKIDGQFVRDLVQDPLDRATVRCFHEVARVMGVKTIAEFVTDDDILAELRDIGIHFAQGYLVHRPEPLDVLMQTYRIGRKQVTGSLQ
ncbi:MAG: bifunctional diguanylate cyclase/phosphodiesterase, partial [Variovorax sp.]|nr:bifunctional diguanylate cyclase/phosphodiesterase [Variovorax sp.]